MSKFRNILLAFILGIASIQCMWADDVRELVESARLGDLDKVKSPINKGIDVNAKNYEVTVLMWASNWGHLEIAKYLISKGANVNIKDFQNETALMWAAKGRKFEVIKILVENGVNVNIRNDDGYTALEMSKTDEIWNYLKPRTRVNVNFALINSSKRGNLKQVKYYLSQGADINAKDNNGYTVLMMAVDYVSYNHLEVVKYLISKGANLNAKENKYGNTALIIALWCNLEAVKALVDSNKFLYFFKINKVDINAQDKFGKSALTTALDCDFWGTKKFDIYFDIVKYLVENGANVNIKIHLVGLLWVWL